MAVKRRVVNRGKGREFHHNDLHSTTGVDRISELPDPLIHHILSFIPTLDVVRMSLLSRCWRAMWRSVPALYFHNTNSTTGLVEFDRETFCAFVTKCLHQRTNDILNVTSLKLDMKAYFEDHTTIDYWLAILLSSSQLKELDLCIRKHTPIQVMYSFPFDASGLTSLTSLKLCGVRILKPHTTSINLPKLVSLALEKVETNDVELNNLLIGCSSLEKLLLKECANLVNPRVLNSTLKFLEIVYGATQPSNPRRRPLETTFHVESVNLQSFAYNRAPYYSNLLLSCGIIQHLLFSNMRCRDQWFEDLIFRLPLLQNLSVCNCKFEQIQVFSQHLKHFVFKGNKRGYALAARINTPNLVSFSFEGDFLSNFLMIAPNILQADIQLRSPEAYDTQWYFSLCDFLRYVDGSKMVSLGIHSEEALIFPREFRRNSWSPLPTLKHLKVTTDLPLSSEAELRRALLWASPSLETLLIEQNQGS